MPEDFMTLSNGNARPQPCFLVGAPRSGTTWLQRVLQAHPAICGGEESHFFTLLAHPMTETDVMAEYGDRPVGPLAYVSRGEFDGILLDVWDKLFTRTWAAKPDAIVHLEKTPFHSLCMEQILHLFPQARFVHLVRDSRAVSASLIAAGNSWGSNWAARTAKAAALDWNRHVTAIERFAQNHPGVPVLQVRYEEALDQTEAVVARILQFVLPQDVDPKADEVLARYQQSNIGRNDPAGFSRMRGRDGWRKDLSIADKLVIWRYTRRKMQELGYDFTPFR
ncbi:sulfotransferase family protein [Thioclava kandeliae]|uniref:Sulfotransferase n=1 Tax=Thioclava kandeliae TaxID=3070818 RepID=A0ABV1SLK6_9RHOB